MNRTAKTRRGAPAKSGRGLERMLREAIAQSASAVASLDAARGALLALASDVVRTLRRGGKVLTAGNGGSAAEALHMAEELVGRFRSNRRALPAVSLCADPTALTCIANDFGFEEVFSRQVEALGRRGDLLVVFSTSGNSPNLLRAVVAAKRAGVDVAAFLGRDGGRLAGAARREVIVRVADTARIQEAHQVAMHLVLDVVEEAFAR